MEEAWWEKPVCYVCDYWWVFLILLVTGLAAYFTRDYWLPEQVVAIPTALPSPTPVLVTVLPLPTPTELVVLGTGDVQVTLHWSGLNDLDLHVTDPAGEVIYFGNTISTLGGQLDIDSNAGCGRDMTPTPIENIFWRVGAAPHGTYKIQVNYYAQCTSTTETPFEIRLLVDGQVQELSGRVATVGDYTFVTQFER